MIRGLYTAASGMMMEVIHQDIIANNIANINTTGYKRDIPVFKDFSKMFIHRLNEESKEISKRFKITNEPGIGYLGTGVLEDSIKVDFSDGPINKTDNPLDLAIKGEGFFAVQTEKDIRYTRDGNFTLNRDGELCTPDGYQVLGQNGPIRITDGEKVTIDEDGNVNVDGINIDTIQILDFEDKQVLKKIGHNLYAAPYDSAVIAGNGKIIQGALEKPNIELAMEMVKMITALRAYEINQKAVQSQDAMLQDAINQVGRVNI